MCKLVDSVILDMLRALTLHIESNFITSLHLIFTSDGGFTPAQSFMIIFTFISLSQICEIL